MSTRHDFTRQYWGHALHISAREIGVYEGLLHCQQRVKEGDELTWRTNYGTAHAKVTKARPVMDPDDMYEVSCVITERIQDQP